MAESGGSTFHYNDSRETYQHPAFEELHAKSGSGYYHYATRLGFGGIFFLTSAGVIPYNPEMHRASTPYYDIYDILRAVEANHVLELVPR